MAMQNNLFSTVSKYTINITQSRYRFCFFYSLSIAFFIFVLINFPLIKRTDTYLVILSLLVFSIIFIGVMNADKSKRKLLHSFMLTTAGDMSFLNEQCSYQLLASSRFSFLGCWLLMKPAMLVEHNSLSETKDISCAVRRYFIYRDSLTGQDFARLIKVLSSLR
jgi:hypothetical protein